MPENQNAAETAQQEAVKANWGALQEDFSEVVVQEQVQQKQDEKVADVDNAEKNDTQDIDSKTDEDQQKEGDKEVKDEKKEETKIDDQKKSDEKTDENQDQAEQEDIFKAEDIKDVPKIYEDGTWRGTAKDLGVELEEESFEAFKNAFVPKAELEKVQQVTLDNIYASLKQPETAVALKLMEMGVPEESVFAPTKEIDGYLAMEDTALVRADLQGQEGWTPDLIDAKIEELVGDPKKLALYAGELRIGLNQQKKNIVETRTKLLQQYDQQKQNVILQQKQQEATQFNEALDKLQTFMGKPVSKEAKEAIKAKHNSGLYDDVVNNADSKVAAIMYKEYGEKLAKLIQNKASEEAKVDTRKKLLNVPPVTSGQGKRVDTNANNQNDTNWGALLEDFK